MLMFWCSVVVALTVLASQFRPVVVLPLLAVVVASTWRFMPAALPTTRASVVSSSVAVAGSALWLVANLPFASRYVTATRDPGVLTLEGLWLSAHPAPDISVGSAIDVQHVVPGLSASTGDPLSGPLQVQGAKLVPGMLGLAGWVGGDQAVLAANLVIGAVALLAVFALARRLVRPAVALVPLAALAVSIPMMVFSRAAYTEPLTLVLVIGGVTMAWSAIETRTWWRYLLAGAMIGGTALVRIDGAASVIGLIGGLGLTAAAALGPRVRRRQVGATGIVIGAALAMVAIGYLDLRLHSPSYLVSLSHQFTALMAALAGTVILVIVLGTLRSLDPLRRWVLTRRRGLAAAAVFGVGVVAAFFASRPLWLVNRRIPAGSPYASVVGALQEMDHLPLDPTRSYDEYSLSWHGMYYGWPMVVLAVVGLSLITYRLVARRDPRLALVLGVVVAPSLLYLWDIAITPDQTWAMRRFLPVTIPGLLIASAVVVDTLWAQRSRVLRALAVAGGVVVAAFPILTWSPVLTTVEQGGRLGEMNAVCAAVGGGPVVYMAVGAGSPPYLTTLRSGCDVDVVQANVPLTASDLAAIKAAWGDNDVKVVTFTPDSVPWAGGTAPGPLRTTTISWWENPLQRIPQRDVESTSRLWVGRIGPDGTLTPVEG
ncbi:hypothetical protein ACPPVS_13365 [Cellulomonas sp. McL0617]|uniref:hypothetical protein n=1 Tax=Cellulomonas sp. McL0617 TaxID=3415675 RepID=UPI003CF7D7F7